MSSNLKITTHIIPASSVRTFRSKDVNKRLQLAVNSYDPITKSNDDHRDNSKTTIIFVHAIGFHKEIWEPVIKGLDEKREMWNGGTMYALDATNHGDSATLNQDILPDSYRWSDYAYDILQVVDHFKIKGPIIGVGHSVGGCAILLAEIYCPGTFTNLISIDPVIYPLNIEIFQKYMAGAAKSKKDIWPNRETMKSSLMKRSFYRAWDPEVLDLYIQHGLRDLPTREVTLKCPKKQELVVCLHDMGSGFEAFIRLPEIQCPILFLYGSNSTMVNPQHFALIKASRCRRGHAIALDCGHLVVHEKPKETAEAILTFLSRNYFASVFDERLFGVPDKRERKGRAIAAKL